MEKLATFVWEVRIKNVSLEQGDVFSLNRANKVADAVSLSIFR